MEVSDPQEQIDEEQVLKDFRNGEAISIVEIRKDCHKVNISPKQDWEVLEDKIKLNLLDIGFSHQNFKTNSGNIEHHFKNSFGINIYITKKRSKFKRIEIDFQGRFFIYKEATRNSKKLVDDLKEIFIDGGIRLEVKSKRIDPALLVIAPSIDTVINTNLEEIINCSTLKPQKFYDKFGKLNGVCYRNSELTLKIYNKGLQLEEESKKLTSEYIAYHGPFLEEAKKRKCILIRIELLIRSSSYLSHYDSLFKRASHDENQAVMDLFDLFNDKHRFRIKGSDYGNKRQTQHLKQDPITKLFSKESNSLKIHREELRQKENIDFVSGMKNSQITINSKFLSLGRSLARINPNFNMNNLDEYLKVLEGEFYTQAPKVKKELKESLLEQARTRIYYSKSKKEIELIIDEYKE